MLVYTAVSETSRLRTVSLLPLTVSAGEDIFADFIQEMLSSIVRCDG